MDTHRDPDSGITTRADPRQHAFVEVPGERSRSLHVRLALPVAGTVLPVLVLAGFIIYSGFVRTREEATARVLQAAQSAMAAVDREIQNQISALQILALEPELLEGDFEEFRDDAERFIQVRSGYVVAVSDASGNQVFNSRVRGDLKPWVNLDAFHEVMRTKRPAISDMYVGGVTEEPTFTVDVPVMRGNEVAYVIGYSPPRENYAEILRRLSLPEDWVSNLYDRAATRVARDPPVKVTGLTVASEAMKKEFARGNNRIVPTVSLEGTPILAAFTRSEESGWVLAIGMPRESLDGPVRNSLALTVALGVTLLLVGLGFSSRLATQIVRAEAQRSLLMNELNHRVKNTLSAVQGIVARGLPELPENEPYRKAAESRLLALSSAHNILSSGNWESAALSDLAWAVIEPYGSRDRMRIEGPDVILAPRITVPLAMVLNELATNAVKYGALSDKAGSLALSWALSAPDRLRLEWRESGGPAVCPPASVGYGTKFIERAVSSELKGVYASAFPSGGFTCTIEFPL